MRFYPILYVCGYVVYPMLDTIFEVIALVIPTKQSSQQRSARLLLERIIECLDDVLTHTLGSDGDVGCKTAPSHSLYPCSFGYCTIDTDLLERFEELFARYSAFLHIFGESFILVLCISKFLGYRTHNERCYPCH